MVKWDDPALLEDNPPPKKSKTPLFIGLGVAVLAAVVVAFFLGGGPSLTPEEEKIFEEAQTALRTDDYDNYPAAEQKLLALLEKYPNHSPSISWLMQMYCAWGDVLKNEAEAIQKAGQAKVKELGDLKKTIESSKSKSTRAESQARFDAAKKELEKLNADGKTKDTEGTAKLNSAKEWAKKGSMVDSDDPQLQRAMADHSRISSKWPDVETRLKYVEKHKPDSAGLRFIKGAMLMEKDRKYDEAIALFEEALRIDPRFTKAQYFIGLAQDKKGAPEKAAEAMKRVLALSPKHQGATAYLQMMSTILAARKSAATAEVAGTDKEKVAAGDEVNPPENDKKDAGKKGKKKKKGK